MKCKVLALCLLLLASTVHAMEGYRLDHACIIFVEPGDSYIGLFGPDWPKIYQTNREFVPYDRQSRFASTPERHLFVGSKLVVPAGTFLTQFAMDRVNRYRKIKSDAVVAIQEAETLAAETPSNPSELYAQAIRALAQAKESADRLTTGFENYIEARMLAREALRLFRMDAGLREKEHRLDLLKEQVVREAGEKQQIQEQVSLLRSQLSILHKQRKIVLDVAMALAVLTILSLLWTIRRKRRKARATRLKAWLDRHDSHIDSLLGAGV